MNDTPELSVIIVNGHSKDRIGKCVRSISGCFGVGGKRRELFSEMDGDPVRRTLRWESWVGIHG
jgi:hypothetical protein